MLHEKDDNSNGPSESAELMRGVRRTNKCVDLVDFGGSVPQIHCFSFLRPDITSRHLFLVDCRHSHLSRPIFLTPTTSVFGLSHPYFSIHLSSFSQPIHRSCHIDSVTRAINVHTQPHHLRTRSYPLLFVDPDFSPSPPVQ